MADKKISELVSITGSATAADDYFVVVDTSGAVTYKISREELNNAIEQDVLSTVDINGGTIDGTVIGATTPAAGTFTDLTVTGTVTGISSDVVDDTTPQLGGNLDTNGNYINFGDNDKAIFGAGSDLQLYHDGSHSYIKDLGEGNLNIQSNGVGVVIADNAASDLAVFNAGSGVVTLFKSGAPKLATTATGVDVTGTVKAKGGSISTPTTNAGLIANSSGKFVVNHGNEYGLYTGYINSSNDAIGIAATEINAGVPKPLVLQPFGGNVGIGISLPSNLLHLYKASGGNYSIIENTSGKAAIGVGSGGEVTISAESASNPIRFLTASGSSEAMRIDGATGNLLVGGTDDNPADNSGGSSFNLAYQAQYGRLLIGAASGEVPLYLNRQSSDGDIVQLRKDGGVVGGIGVSGTRLTVGSGGSASGIRFDGAQWIPTISNVESDNGVDIGWTSSRIRNIYLSGGVYLGGTGSANKLDDYEEGTWTPTASSGLGGAYGGVGKYTKVGRSVYCFGSLNVTDITADIVIGGLPFTSSNDRATTVTATLIGATATQNSFVETLATTFNIERTGTYSGGAISIYFGCWYFI